MTIFPRLLQLLSASHPARSLASHGRPAAHRRPTTTALLGLAAALTLCGSAPFAGAQTTYSSSGGISISGEVVHSGNSSTLSVSGGSSTVSSISYVTLSGVTSNGSADNSIGYATFVLESPDGTRFVLLGATGDGTDNGGLTGITIKIEDGQSAAPGYGQDSSDAGGPWPDSNKTVAASSYWLEPVGTVYSLPSELDGFDFPATDGADGNYGQGGYYTLNTAFDGKQANGAWTLYIYNDDNGGANDPISISGWSITMTVAASESVSTTTSISTSVSNPASTFTGITYTATVSAAGSTVNDGGVTFYANGSAISGCSGRPVSSGMATCSTSFSNQGLYDVSATYTAGTGFLGSSTTEDVKQLVEQPTSHNGDTWCNTGSFTVPGESVGIVYPSVIKIPANTYSSSVADVEVELMGVSGDINSFYHLLVGPGGTNNLGFLENGFDSSPISNLNLNFLDTGSGYATGTPTNNSSWLPTDEFESASSFDAETASTFDSSIPGIPATINFADPEPTYANNYSTVNFSSTFGSSGLIPNGTWALYIDDPGTDDTLTVNGGWCVALTLNSGTATTTTVSSSLNAAEPNGAYTGNAITLTATVSAGGNPVNEGTVTFYDNGAAPAGVSNNVVNVSGGTASITTSSLAEGDHTISAYYTDSSKTFDDSQQTTFVQRVDHKTTVTSSNGVITACNAGGFASTQSHKGPFTPNPSNIYVQSLPGTIQNVTLGINDFTTGSAGINETESLVEGPTGAALDFFSSTGNGSTVLTNANLLFEDSGSGAVPQSPFGGGDWQPTSYTNVNNDADSFTSSTSSFYPAPGSFAYAAPRGTGTFANTFEGSNGNGLWSLYFDLLESTDSEGSPANDGWCLNFTESPVTITPSLGHNGAGQSGDFVQGEQNAPITLSVAVADNTGPTGDPSGTNPFTVVDTLPAGFTYVADSVSGTDWSCNASGQTVTCTNDDAIAQGNSYPTLTFDVNVADGASGSLQNSISVSGAGVSTSTNPTTDNIPVDSAANLGIGISHSGTFTQGQTGQWNIQVSNTAATGITYGTVTVNDTLPAGYTLASYSGTGWSCTGVTTQTANCTSTQGVAGGASFMPLTLTVNIPSNSPASVSNTASAYGGGDLNHTQLSSAVSATDSNVPVVQTTVTTPASQFVNYSASAQNVTLSATVTSGGSPVTAGTVTFAVYSGPTLIAGPATSNTLDNTGTGTATVSIPGGTASGTYTIDATYNGTSAYQTSTNSATLTVTAAATLSSPSPGSILIAGPVTFNWTAGTGATNYVLHLGSTRGGNDLRGTGFTTANSVTFSGLPTNGQIIYARLYTFFPSGYAIEDYTFTAASQAALTSPAPTSTLTDTSVTFNWTPGSGAGNSYVLHLGSTPGGNDLRGTGTITGTSVTFTGLPANGQTIYARLYTFFTSAYGYTDYTYTAAAPAALTSPAPTSTLTAGPMTFNWTSVPGATGYVLHLGSTPGGNDIHGTGMITANSFTFNYLPANGQTVYARLYTYFASGVRYVDYTYTAAP